MLAMAQDEGHFRAVLRYVERELFQALRVRSHADGASARERQLHEQNRDVSGSARSSVTRGPTTRLAQDQDNANRPMNDKINGNGPCLLFTALFTLFTVPVYWRHHQMLLLRGRVIVGRHRPSSEAPPPWTYRKFSPSVPYCDCRGG